MEIRPFCAMRPQKAYAHQVAALPYDVMNTNEAREIVQKSGGGLSFLQIDKPELLLEEQCEASPYELAGKRLARWYDEGVFIKEQSPSFYIYVLERGEQQQYGLVTTLKCADYDSGHIKKHEHTRKDKEQERIEHIAGCQAHTGPIFLMGEGLELLSMWMEEYCRYHEPLYDFKRDDDVRHHVYLVDAPQVIYNIQCLMATQETLYIADGHHRCAAAAAYCKAHPEQEEAAYFLGVVFPKEYLSIMDYNRVLKDTSQWGEKVLLERLKENFNVERVHETYFKPKQKHHFGMRLAKKWYHLELKPEKLIGLKMAQQLDVALLQDLVLRPLFHIEDPRIDRRIDFVGGIRGIEALNDRTDEEMDVAFSLYPTAIQELIAIANVDGVMPPKSTWFEPKLLSGLFIHCI